MSDLLWNLLQKSGRGKRDWNSEQVRKGGLPPLVLVKASDLEKLDMNQPG